MKESCYYVYLDRWKKIYRDRCKIWILLIDNGYEWKLKRGMNKFDILRLLIISKMLYIYVYLLWFYYLLVNINFGWFYCGKDL